MIKIFTQSLIPIFVNIFSLIFLFYISEKLSSDDLAYYFINLNIFLVSGAIIQFGFSISGIKLLEKFKEKGCDYISETISLCMVARLILFIFSIFAYIFLTYLYSNYDFLIFSSWLIYIVAVFFDFEFIFLYFKKLYLPYFFRFLFINTSLFIIFIFDIYKLYDFLLIWSLIYFFTNIILMLCLKRLYGFIFTAPSRTDFIYELKESFVYFSSSFVVLLCYKIPFFYLAYRSESKVINFYSLFEKINEALKVFIQYLARFKYQSLIKFKNVEYIKKNSFIIKSSLAIFLILQLVGLIFYNFYYQYFNFIPNIISDNKILLFMLPMSSLITYYLISIGLNKISIKYGFFTLLKLNIISLFLINIIWFFPKALSTLESIVLVLIVDITIVIIRYLFLFKKKYENYHN